MTVAQKLVQKMARAAADTLELEHAADGTCILRFRYGRESEPFKLRGETEKDQARDLGVNVEKFMGAR